MIAFRENYGIAFRLLAGFGLARTKTRLKPALLFSVWPLG